MQISYPSWCEKIETSALQKMLAVCASPEIISFTMGLPDPALFPIDAIKRATNKVIDNDRLAFQYSLPTQKLKEQIVALMKRRGVNCKEKQVFITTGAQQGLSLLTRLLVDKGDNVILENLVYPGMTQALMPLQPQLLPVNTNYKDGIDLAELKQILEIKLGYSFLYLVCEGSNPLATSLSLENRQELSKLAKQYSLPILEDDPYGFLQYENSKPALKSLEPDWVFYIGSFSKILAPSFRIGWLVVPEQMIERIAILKESTDINTATFTQWIASYFLEDNSAVLEHLYNIRQVYKKKRDVMVEALIKYLPDDVVFDVPKSGIFIWVELPKSINALKLLTNAIEKHKVAFIPGNAFSVMKTHVGINSMRLNFSYPNIDDIEKGVKHLGNAIRTYQQGGVMQACTV